MLDIIAWLAALTALTLLGFPAAHLVMRRLPDRGCAVAPVLALLTLAWTTWMGGVLGVIPNSQLGIGATLTLLGIGSAVLAWRQRAELPDFLRRRWPLIITIQLTFLAVFAFWALLISEAPAINHTEKPMDFGIMNAVVHADRFPPQDQWLAGHSIAYYYGGHLIAAMLATLAGVPTDTAYNLAMATIPALLAAGLVGLIYNLLRFARARFAIALSAAVAAALAIVFLGNGSGMLELAYARGWGSAGFWEWLGVKGLLAAPETATGWLPQGYWWWWRGSRIIDTLSESGASLDYTITEMPFFSFLLGDLHAHASALPFAILALCLALALLKSPIPPGLEWFRRRPCEAPTLALTLGALAFINAWDFPLYIAVTAGAATLCWYAAGHRLPAALARAAALALALTAAGILLYLPFYLSFDSQAAGILPVTGPATRPAHFLLVMGAPAILAAGLVARAALPAGRPPAPLRNLALAVVAASLAPLILWLLAVGIRVSLAGYDAINLADGILAGRLTLALPLLAAGGLAAYCALTAARSNANSNTDTDRATDTDTVPTPTFAFALLLAAAGFYLLATAELFHIADQFGNRMNTVFKIYYQAWLLLGIAGAVGVYYIVAVPFPGLPRPDHRGPERLRRYLRRPLRPYLRQTMRFAWPALAALLVIASAYYPAAAVIERTGWGQDGASWSDNTLSGLDYLRHSAPGEYEAIRWLQRKAPPGGIVEAVGDGYTDYGRIAAATGRPTVIGWEGHERQWRGDDHAFAGRRQDVAAIYQSDDGNEVTRLLRRYAVRWVILGPRELHSYGADTPARMTRWTAENRLTRAFSAGDLLIYEVQSQP